MEESLIISKDNLEIDYKIYSLLDTENITFQVKTTGLGMIELSNYFFNSKPDIVITIADRFETIATENIIHEYTIDTYYGLKIQDTLDNYGLEMLLVICQIITLFLMNRQEKLFLKFKKIF